ncbi:unknown [Phocaeicola coprophilus CAG:333]|nr:unknown [Phocaeicola coprophilus CAG:333]
MITFVVEAKFISTKALVPSCKGSLTSADLLIDVLPKAA